MVDRDGKDHLGEYFGFVFGLQDDEGFCLSEQELRLGQRRTLSSPASPDQGKLAIQGLKIKKYSGEKRPLYLHEKSLANQPNFLYLMRYAPPQGGARQ